MTGFTLFNDLFGIPLNAFDARALSEEEIQKFQYANMASTMQAKLDPDHYRRAMNWNPFPPDARTLGERFANFKIRLSEAQTKRRKTS